MGNDDEIDEVKVSIIGTGSYLPQKVLTNKDLERMVDTSDEWIVTRTGIRERRIASPQQAASDLGTEAAKDALANAKVSPEELDAIIVATITPDMLFPSTACIIQNNLGAKKAFALDLSAACSGFIYGLAVAYSFLKTKLCDKILVVASEVLSKITDWQDRNTCVLLGDGAGAAVLASTKEEEAPKQILSFFLASQGEYGDLLNMPAGGSRIPASIDSVKNRLHFLKMKGREVFKIAVISMLDAARKGLEKCNISLDKLRLLIPHQANIRIIDAISERLGLSSEQVYINVDKYGNMSAATVAVAFDEVSKANKLNRGDIDELVAFGAGFTSGACVIKW